MIFNSVEFIIFFPIVVFVYYILPHKARYMWLLAASYYFYMNWNPLYALLLFSCTFVTYVSGLILDKLKDTKGSEKNCELKRKLCLVGCLFVCLGILGFFKYRDFAVININRVLGILHLGQLTWEHSIVLPVGISFYTLQALGYLIDVYRGDIYAEKNFFRYHCLYHFSRSLSQVRLNAPKICWYSCIRQKSSTMKIFAAALCLCCGDFSKGGYCGQSGDYCKYCVRKS